MPLPEVLAITPFTTPVSATAIVPGSKSLTNRALLLASLCGQPVRLIGALFSEDTHLMTEALRQLGLTIVADENAHAITVSGQEKAFPAGDRELFVGLAGTAARFLTALCAAAPRGVYRLDGVPQMRKRPMKPLLDALRQLGADIRCTGEEGFFPFEIRANGLRGGRVDIDARESSQLLSALLMVAPLARGPIAVHLVGTVRWPFVRMTARLMEQFGQPPIAQTSETSFTVAHGHAYAVPRGTYAIEPDATAASYFLALPLVTTGRVILPRLRGAGEGLQGDTAFMRILQQVGAAVAAHRDSEGVEVSHTRSHPRHGVVQDFSEFSDTFLTLAAIAPLLTGPTRITGIRHTRKQETDRVAGMAAELKRLGQNVIESDDSLEIHPQPLRTGQTIETYGDHRFAMSFGILGCHDLAGDGKPWLNIRDPGCCAKTFPNFFELLEAVRRQSVTN